MQLIYVIYSSLLTFDVFTKNSWPLNHRVLCLDDQIWKKLCESKFLVPRKETPPSSWYELYKFNKMVFKRLYTLNTDNQNHANALMWPALHTGADGLLLIRSRAN